MLRTRSNEPPAVLLVEDEALIAFALEEELIDAGFQVHVIAESKLALQEIEHRVSSYRALLTDIDLGGGVDGWQLAKRARELSPQIPVIYMSGKSAIEWSANGVPNSIMLQKPFVVPQMITAIATLMNAQQPSQEASSKA